jgi:glycosyltransferase involved in cell wall biosynthesis
MKIAWFTPFSQNSAIGKYSQSITEELIKYSEVELWVPSGEGTLLDTNLKIIPFTSDDIQISKLDSYDCIVYNIGDHLGFHEGIYEVSKRIKGLVILHDFVMHHFFAGYYLVKLKDENAYIREMKKFYGVEGQNVAIDSLNGRREHIWETDSVIKYPLFEKAIEGSLGVIVHSRFLAEEVKKDYLGPVAMIYHPFYRDTKNMFRQLEKVSPSGHQDQILMVTIGNVNPNKRIDKVISTIGKNSDLASKVNYVVIGQYEHDSSYFSLLQSLLAKYSLQNRVKFLGFQPDEILNSYLKRADLCLNLRFPAMEGASWSLIEQLSFGKSVLVTDTGFYSEIPDECVVKINPDREDEELTIMLEKLISDKNLRDKIGTRGREFAIENFSASKYCKNFLNFLEDVRGYRPLLDLTDRVGLELNRFKATERMATTDVVANEIYKIFKTGKMN